MNREIILSNLARRPVRTAVSVLAVSIEVMLILMVVGLVTGINTETGMRTQGVGADIMFQPPNSSIFLGLNSAVMPAAIGDRLLQIDGVEAVAPVVTQFNSQGGFDVVYGIDPASFNAVSGGFRFLAGGPFDDPYEVLIDNLYAEAKGLGVGDELSVLNHRFQVSGIVENGKGARLFLSLETAQAMTGAEDKASLFFVKLASRDVLDPVRAEMEAVFPTYPAHDMQEMVSLMMNTSVPALDAFLSVIVGIAVVIGALVIFLSMYTSISERTREIGILRSLGASKALVVKLILNETFWLCLAGVAVGLGLSFAGARLVQWEFPTLMILISGEWIFRAAFLAILSGLVGSLYPSLRAAGEDPVEALAYE